MKKSLLFCFFFLFSLQKVGPHRVGGVGKDSALTTVLHRGVVTLAGEAVLGLGVHCAFLLALSTAEDADVSRLSPGGSPGVADNPVELVTLRAVSDHLDSVVDFDTTALRGEDTALVQLPGRSRCRDGDGSDVCDRVHDRSVVVGLKLDEPLHARDRLDLLGLAREGDPHPRGVRVVLLGGDPGLRGVVERKPLGRPFASSGTSALQGVGHAGDNLLLGEGEKGAGCNGGVRFDRLNSAEGPAGAAHCLVLDCGHDVLLSPVNGVGEGGDGHVGGGRGGGELLSRGAVETLGDLGEFGLGPVGIVVDTHLPAVVGSVVCADLRQVGLEDGLAGEVLLRGVRLLELTDIVLEGVLRGLEVTPCGAQGSTAQRQQRAEDEGAHCVVCGSVGCMGYVWGDVGSHQIRESVR